MRDDQRIYFAASYLSGTAAQWFSNYLIQTPLPRVVTHWDTFVQEFNAMFGDRNRVLTAQHALQYIQMEDSHQVSRYVVEFQKWGNLTGYDDTALSSLFYRGLCNRIKDQFALVGRPSEFTALRDQALRFDQHFWDRQAELARSGAQHLRSTAFPAYDPTRPARVRSDPSRSSTSTSAASGSTNSGNQSGRTAQNSQTQRPPQSNRSNNSGRNNNSNNNNNSGNAGNNNTNRSAPRDRLTAEGRLMDAERDRRRRLGLCMYCAESGHIYNDCPRNPRSTVNQGNNSARPGTATQGAAARPGTAPNPPRGPNTPSNQPANRGNFGRATFTISPQPEETPAEPAVNAGNATPTQ